MIRLDLDDVPPRIAKLLRELAAGEELVLVEGGGVVARLLIAEAAADAAAPLSEDEVDAEAHMEEVLEHFKLMIEDEI